MKAVASYLSNTPFVKPSASTVAGEVITVPSVEGLAPRQAARILRKAGFIPTIDEGQVDSAYPQGTVAYLSVRAGAPVPVMTPITIYVSDGTPAKKPKKDKKNKKQNRGNRD